MKDRMRTKDETLTHNSAGHIVAGPFDFEKLQVLPDRKATISMIEITDSGFFSSEICKSPLELTNMNPALRNA